MSDFVLAQAPSEWRRMTLAIACEDGGSIQTGPFGSQLHASDYVAEGIPTVMPQDLGDNVIRDENVARISVQDAERLEKYRLRAGDIIYSRRGDVTRRALVRAEQVGWLCGTGCLRVRPGRGVVPSFLSYYLGHPEVREWIVRHAVGATMPNLNTGILGAVPLVMPNISEQNTIAGLLGALDDKIAVNERIASTVDELAAAMFESSTAELSEEVLLREVATVNRASVKAIKVGSLRYVDISSVGVGTYEWPLQIQWLEAPGRARRKAAAGDTIWSTVRPNRRSHAFVLDDDPDLVFSTGLAVLSPDSIGPATLYEATKVPTFQAYLESVAEGSAYPAVRAEQFNNAMLSIPAGDKRAWFEDAAMSLRIRAYHASVESRTLAKLRDSLLPQLMSGRIRVKDAEKLVEDAV